jgi:hypothetical protein
MLINTQVNYLLFLEIEYLGHFLFLSSTIVALPVLCATLGLSAIFDLSYPYLPFFTVVKETHANTICFHPFSFTPNQFNIHKTRENALKLGFYC